MPVKYKIENNEIYRLSILGDYKILDTEFDSRFDDLVVMASAQFGVPIAIVSLVDADRQWFKAMVGLDVRQTPRRHSFCTHAIVGADEVMVVEDAKADPRFQGNPLVETDPHIRFYAGAPIVTDSGAALGTVAVMDRQPRAFDAADRAMLARFAGTARSLLELHRRNALLREAAMHDPQTGLLNRRGLEKTLRQMMRSALDGEGCGLLCLDLDDFKTINDAYGYAIGDSLLEETARRLQGAVRQGDLVARFGGDEFVILLAHPVDADVLELVAQRVLLTCSATVTLDGKTIMPSVTIGGALAPRDAITQSDLLRAAESALYAAKRAGHGQFVIAGPADKSRPAIDRTPQIALSDAIDRDELFLEWQSCHDIKTGAIAGYEALVRWQHPELGRLAPDRFVPLAEACGLSSRLDAWVMFHACEEAAACQGDCHFSVNVSAQWIANGNVVPLVRAALEQSGLSPDRLVVEITESTAIGSEDDAIDHMRQLRALGVRLALDDFGTGYSALVCLQTYPFDMLKLDRKFVSAMSAKSRGRLVSEGVIQLARMLDIEVVAEGIETQAQADLLSEIGCRRGQGFLWAKPKRAPWLGSAIAKDNSTDGPPGQRLSNPDLPAEQRDEAAILAALPSANTTRWIPHRKAEVVAAVNGGMISVEYVCQRYNLTMEEFGGWQRAVDLSGLKGLRTTRTQFYRDLYKSGARPGVGIR